MSSVDDVGEGASSLLADFAGMGESSAWLRVLRVCLFAAVPGVSVWVSVCDDDAQLLGSTLRAFAAMGGSCTWLQGCLFATVSGRTSLAGRRSEATLTPRS